MKKATHVQFNPGMLFNVSSFAQPNEPAGELLSCTVLCLPGAQPGQPVRVRVFTGDMNGTLREFNCDTGTWAQSRSAKHDGPVTALLAVHDWLFVGLHVPNANGPMGVLKAYNLGDNREFNLVDSRGLPAAHMVSVKCLIAGSGLLVSGGGEGQVKAWKFGQNWSLAGVYGGDVGAHDQEVDCMSTKIPNLLISGSHRGEVKVWRLGEGECTAHVQAHQGPIGAMDVLSVAEDKHYLLTCGELDNNLRLWLVLPNQLQGIHQMTLAPPHINKAIPNTALRVVKVGNQQQLFIGAHNGSVQVYNMRGETNFQRLGVVDGHERQTKVLMFETVEVPGGVMLCIATAKGFVNWFQVAVQ